MTSLLHPKSHRSTNERTRWSALLISAGVLALAFLLGQRVSLVWLGLLATCIGGLIVIIRPTFIPWAVAAVALLSPVEIGTNTDVKLNAVSLIIPVLGVIWLLNKVIRRDVCFAGTRASWPLLLFLAASLLSLLIGRATWDPSVPIGGNFLLVQLAQWGIFAFSALAFWLGANLISSQRSLQRLTTFCLLVIGAAAILDLLPGVRQVITSMPASALGRVPLLALLVGLGAGQLLFNRQLPTLWRIFLTAALLAVLVYTVVIYRDYNSGWITLAATLGTLIWLRFPRPGWFMVILVSIATIAGLLGPAVYEFAGGDEEWSGSGASRLVLIERVVEVTMRNPITGLGPAAYRPYTAVKPLLYLGANWSEPRVNSHNNYVDVFSHAGIIGLALFVWFMVAMARHAWRMRQRFQVSSTNGFAMGYVNGMLAVWVACMVGMLIADVFLPFAYNVGFSGFQASVLVWLFLGGLVALERFGDTDESRAKRIPLDQNG